MGERLCPVEIHCFSQDGRHILLHVSQSRFFALTPAEREVLAALKGTPLETWRDELRGTYDDAEIGRALECLRKRGLLLLHTASSGTAEPLAAPITHLELNVAQDCNLRCRYCIVEQGSFGARRQQMSAEVARQAVDFLLRESGEASFCGFTFFGGEPLLNFAVIEDVVLYSQEQAARQGKQMRYFLITNGTLFNDENIAFIKKHRIRVQVSLDGPPAVHDRLRSNAAGRGSHAAIVASLPQLLTDYAEQVFIRATVTRYSPPTPALLDYLADFGANLVSLHYVMAEEADYALDPAARERLKAEYTALARRFLTGAPAGDFSAVNFFRPYMAHFCSGRRRRTCCAAGASMLGVSASGGLYPCKDLAEREEYRLGHVATGLDRERLARWRSYLDVDSRPLCRDCWARYICGGGCLSWAIKLRRECLRPVEMECELIQHLIELAIWVHLELREKYPQVFLPLLPILGFDAFPLENLFRN